MTPPDHLLVGWSCANILYSVLAFFKKDLFSYTKMTIILVLTAIAPDIDSFFGAYTSRDPWVGHRGMTHSFLGVLVLAIIITISVNLLSIALRVLSGYWKFLVSYFKKKDLGKESDFVYWKYTIKPFFPAPFFVLLLCAFIAGVSHLIIDMPQPPSVWKGIPLLFPLKTSAGEYARYGGWPYIGWYDLKISWVFIAAVSISLPAIVVARFFNGIKLRIIAMLLFAVIAFANIGTFVWMGNYIASSRYTNERTWWDEQMKQVKTFPPEISKLTNKGIKVFLSLWRQARQY